MEQVAQALNPMDKFANLACDHVGLFKSGIPQDQLCNFASTYCEGDFVNFYELYYCGFGQSMTGLIFFYILLIFLIFKYTSIVVDEYIAEGITVISEKLQFSESLAAVT